MAGANKILKAGQVVFRAGEAADGMYLVRKGELVVYLEQDGKEVELAKIGEGGMIGEMALFDRQPRSASVKATADSEVTLISLDDFSKLMKQIPKWFVGLMTALSGRLRTTNDRLKQVESSAKAGGAILAPVAPASSGKPFQGFLRMIHVLELMWHKDGTKEGKDWCLSRKTAEEALINMFGETPVRVKALFDLLVKEQIVTLKSDQYKNALLALANRGALRQFAEFVSSLVQANPNQRAIPEATMAILNILHKLSAKAPYEQFTCTDEDVLAAAKTSGLDSSNWGPTLKSFMTYGEVLKPVKSSSKSGIGFRIAKNEFPALLKNLNMFNRIAAAKLDQN